MIRKIVYSLVSIAVGLFLLIFPAFLQYFNNDTFSFDISSFLTDYPAFRFILGILLIIFGATELVFLFFFKKLKNVFVIQEGGDGDYGNPDLHFSKMSKGNNDELIYTNLATSKNHSDDLIKLEKKQIRLFYEKLPKEKRISFLAVASIPSIVYAGYIVGESGRKINYYHWDRKKAKAKRIAGFKQNRHLFKEEVVESLSKSEKEYVVCISTSYLPNKNQILAQFKDKTLFFYQYDEIGIDSIKTKKDLIELANSVRTAVSEIKVPGAIVNLILQCSAEACFAIGQKMNSPALPTIRIFSYDNKNEVEPWDWFISLD